MEVVVVDQSTQGNGVKVVSNVLLDDLMLNSLGRSWHLHGR